jgi:hypothetical protein
VGRLRKFERIDVEQVGHAEETETGEPSRTRDAEHAVMRGCRGLPDLNEAMMPADHEEGPCDDAAGPVPGLIVPINPPNKGPSRIPSRRPPSPHAVAQGRARGRRRPRMNPPPAQQDGQELPAKSGQVLHGEDERSGRPLATTIAKVRMNPTSPPPIVVEVVIR